MFNCITEMTTVVCYLSRVANDKHERQEKYCLPVVRVPLLSPGMSSMITVPISVTYLKIVKLCLLG